MAGLEVVKLATNSAGGIDLDDLRAKADRDVACLMLTNPNTLGVFDPNIEEIASHRPRCRRDALLRRREPQRSDGHLAAGRHGLRHRALQPPQVLHPAPRRRGARVRADRGVGAHRALPTGARGRAARDGGRSPERRAGGYECALRPGLRQRAGGLQDDRATARLPGQLRVLRARVRVHPLARRGGAARRVRERGPQRQLPARRAARARSAGAAAARVRRALHARVRALRRPDEARPRDQDARPRQAPARLRLTTRRPSTSRCSSTRR